MFLYMSPDANLFNFPLSDKPSSFCDSPHSQRGCPSSSSLGPPSPSPTSTLRTSWHRLSILYWTLELSRLPFYWAAPISFTSLTSLSFYGEKNKEPPSTHFPPRVTARTLSFPSQPYLRGLPVTPRLVPHLPPIPHLPLTWVSFLKWLRLRSRITAMLLAPMGI